MPTLRMGRASRAFVQWVLLGTLVGVAAGASALFLFLLEHATRVRCNTRPWCGRCRSGACCWGSCRRATGSRCAAATTWSSTPCTRTPRYPCAWRRWRWWARCSHLFGGSAGREGTAVQMGAGLADAISHGLRVSAHAPRAVAAGIAGGFGSVFGTPIAGAVFGLEVVRGSSATRRCCPRWWPRWWETW